MKRAKELSLAYRRAREKRVRFSRRKREGELQKSVISAEQPHSNTQGVELRNNSTQALASTSE
jgi:hypothetical protein